MKLGKIIAAAVAIGTLLFMTSTMAAGSVSGAVKTAIVQIFTDSAARNIVQPWKVDTLGRSTGSGVIIDGERILTAAHVVKDGVEIYVRKAGSDRRYRASASFTSDSAELAILSVTDEQFFEGVSSLKLGVLPELGDAVTVWGFPQGGDQIAITKGIVSRIDFDIYAHSGFENLVCQVDAAISSGASGGAAVVDGQLAGISFQRLDERDADNVGYIIPVPVIRQFLDDIKDGTVHGVPAITAKFQHMKNPQLREFYAMTPDMGGVLIVETPGGEQGNGAALRAGDVLLGIDGVEVGNDGTAPFQSGDRINARYFVTRHQVGDTIAIRLLRAGKELVVDLKLEHRFSDVMLVTRSFAGFMPDYEIVGGVVFQELNDTYIINAFRSSERSAANESNRPPWMELAYTDFKSRRGDGRQKAVFVSGILADEINLGYEVFEDHRVERVNATQIHNLDDLRRALAANKAPFHVFDFENRAGQIVFDRQRVQQRESLIRQRYQLGER